VIVRLGSPITGYGQENRNRAARQRISNRTYVDEDGVERVEVNVQTVFLSSFQVNRVCKLQCILLLCNFFATLYPFNAEFLVSRFSISPFLKMELDVFAYYCHRSTSSQRISSTSARSVL
jgi:hypothetical protein